MWIMRSVVFSFLCLGLSFSLAFSAEKKKSLSLNELFKSADNTVVLITVGGKIQGSGVAVKDGNLDTASAYGTIIVTNAHVTQDFKKVSVVTNKKTEFVGSVIAVDKEVDLALVQIEGIALKVVKLASADTQLNIGDSVFAVGSPKGMSNSLSEGVISGLRLRGSTSVIQTTAAISKGSSGGGLFDRRGKLIGITTFKVIDGENVNFAVHVKHIKELLNKPVKEISTKNTSIVMSHIKSGGNYFDLKQYERAIEEYSQAIRLEPNNAIAYEKRGSAYTELKQSVRAIADYDQSLRLDPNETNEWAYFGRGGEYTRLNQLDRALSDFNKYILFKPDVAYGYYNRGLVYKKMKQYELAIADFDEAIRLDPTYHMTYYDRGIAHENIKKHELAVADYDQSIRLNPNHGSSYNNRAIVYINLKNYQNGCADAEKACSLGSCRFFEHTKEKRWCK